MVQLSHPYMEKPYWKNHSFDYIDLCQQSIQKSLNDLDNHDDVITHLQPDILECEVKWALGSITMDSEIWEKLKILKSILRNLALQWINNMLLLFSVELLLYHFIRWMSCILEFNHFEGESQEYFQTIMKTMDLLSDLIMHYLYASLPCPLFAMNGHQLWPMEIIKDARLAHGAE